MPDERITYVKDHVTLHGDFTVDDLKKIIGEMNLHVRSSPLALQLIGSRRSDLDDRVARGEITAEQAATQYKAFVSDQFSKMRKREKQ